VIFYESCHRLGKSLADLKAVLEPDRLVSIAGELTKLHESSTTCPIGELKIPTAPRGEWVIVVAKSGYGL
jgi:16S rRNA (cytidine1402-2'-O)-methyltransferase